MKLGHEVIVQWVGLLPCKRPTLEFSPQHPMWSPSTASSDSLVQSQE